MYVRGLYRPLQLPFLVAQLGLSGVNMMKTMIVGIVAATSLLMAASSGAVDMPDVAKKNNCAACHTVEKKLVGPAWQVVSDKYKGDAGAAEKIRTKILKGGVGVFGAVPMPAYPKVTDADIKELVAFILGLAK